MKKLNKTQGNHRKVVLDNYELGKIKIPVALYDCVQEQEDGWVSTILGSETDALNDSF